MTFQNFLSRIPKWNSEIVAKEVERITQSSGCDYLEDLITCVHVIQLKALTCIRVGMEHRAIDIEIPKLDTFIHKVYILLARKLYTNVYLYEENIAPLDQQRNNREMEIMVRECILEAVRESIPIESILKAYLDKTVEENVETVVTTLSEPEPEPSPLTESEQKKQKLGEGESPTVNVDTSESKSLENMSDISRTTVISEGDANVNQPASMPSESIASDLWSFLLRWIGPSLYSRRTKFSPQIEGNGLELWRTLVSEYQGSDELIKMAGRARLLDFLRAKRLKRLTATSAIGWTSCTALVMRWGHQRFKLFSYEPFLIR